MEDFNPDDEAKEAKREEEEEGDLVGHEKPTFSHKVDRIHFLVVNYHMQKVLLVYLLCSQTLFMK